MLSVFSNEDYGRFFDEYVQKYFSISSRRKIFYRYDFLFDDEDDESHHSDLTDEEELRFVDENNLSDNDDENSSTPVWH
jgi:hypothetical protein